MFLAPGPRHFMISIHAPREGGDDSKHNRFHTYSISIHAPREGGDYLMAALLSSLGISIHAPREGGDVIVCMTVPVINIFQSTPPARGATRLDYRHSCRSRYFNPRPPRGGRRHNPFYRLSYHRISIHAPREGGDSKDAQFYL